MEVENKKQTWPEKPSRNQRRIKQIIIKTRVVESAAGSLVEMVSLWIKSCDAFCYKKEAKFFSLGIVNTPKALRAIETCWD